MIVGKNHRKMIEKKRKEKQEKRAYLKWGSTRILDVVMRHLRVDHKSIISNTLIFNSHHKVTGSEKVKGDVTISNGVRYSITIERVPTPDEERLRGGF